MTVSYSVDVSSHQDSHQNWRGFGVHMGIAKASEGQHSHDPWFVRHLADIKAAGLVPGAYHFAWPNQDVTAEAANYVAAVRPVNRPDLVHILDLEPYPNGARNYTGRSDAQIRAWADRWVALIRKAFPEQRVLAYTPRDAYAKHFPAGTDGYWYPAYPVQGRSFAQAAAIARPVVGGHPVWGWQFTSVPLDRTVIYMPPGALEAWAAGTNTEHQEDDEMPTAQEIAAAVWAHTEQGPTGTRPVRMGAVMGWMDTVHSNQSAALRSAVAELGALKATVAAIQEDGGLTAEQITAAAQAGAQAALDQLGTALTKEN